LQDHFKVANESWPQQFFGFIQCQFSSVQVKMFAAALDYFLAMLNMNHV